MAQRNDKPFFISSKEGCKYCTFAKIALTSHDLGYIESVLNEDGLKALKEKGYETVPQIWHGDQHIGGYTELMPYLAANFPE